jgi:O-antigen/teichoic acid export membrane protein
MTYFWHGISILLNLAAMFVVVPMLTNNKIIFGIYSICISTAIFLSYADLGFVTAGVKYAAESFATGNIKKEVKFHGFSSFILLIFVSLIAALYVVFSFYPSILIDDINNSEYLNLASQLLLIQAIFSFTTIIQRFASGVFMVRVEQYINQKITVTGALLKILSVFYFFTANKYDILGYFIFIKMVDLTTGLIGVIILKRKYNFPLLDYLRSIKFDRTVFNRTKGLAFSSLFATLMWIAYYELDIIAIGLLLGASAVAIFALAFTFMKFIRTLVSIIFSPFVSRYNHYVGLDNFEGLRALVFKVVRISMPIVIMTSISVVLLSKNLVLTWAGTEYAESGIILFLLAINFAYSFFVIPASNMLVTLERLREMYFISFLMVAIFWVGVFLTQSYWGVYSFAIFKTVAGTFSAIFYLKFILSFLKINLYRFFKVTINNILLPAIVQVSFILVLMNYLPEAKGSLNLIVVVGIGGFGALLGFITLYFTSSYYKTQFKYYLNRVIIEKLRVKDTTLI